MASPILGFDHPVIAVRDMVEARRTYERLGFTVPPRGSHIEWGTGNWCIMFAEDYLELRGGIDPSRYLHGLDAFLARREGLMGMAFASADSRASLAELGARGFHPREPRELTRNFELPQGNVQPRFRLVFFEPAELPGLMASLICEHLTPELIRRPEWLHHANGALAVAGVTAVVEDVAAAAAALTRAFAAEPATPSPTAAAAPSAEVTIGRGGSIALLSPAAAGAAGLALAGVTPPYLSAVTLRVAGRARAARVLAEAGMAFTRETDGTLRVAAAQACGAILRFAGPEAA